MIKSIINKGALLLAVLLITACGRTIPEGLGLSSSGQLIDCPDSPNCVSTQTKKEKAQIEPIQYNIEDKAAWLLLVELVKQAKLAEIIKEDNNYMHVAYYTKSKIFIDDVEFLQDKANKQFHFRSASRVGHSDLGANRKRMEKIRGAFLDKQGAL